MLEWYKKHYQKAEALRRKWELACILGRTFVHLKVKKKVTNLWKCLFSCACSYRKIMINFPTSGTIRNNLVQTIYDQIFARRMHLQPPLWVDLVWWCMLELSAARTYQNSRLRVTAISILKALCASFNSLIIYVPTLIK